MRDSRGSKSPDGQQVKEISLSRLSLHMLLFRLLPLQRPRLDDVLPPRPGLVHNQHFTPPLPALLLDVHQARPGLSAVPGRGPLVRHS
ncbi:hypothetical protein CH063_15742 [Colletotrichum higginsianum]|uniref:Uncharacterized protein n=1 Tax=Colletotrichum higginsianum (strain IMI 349063) TaxID=759273 RepID=H1W477_COLHI|nr:hypothetical protein CH063_15742 [Colletotrichum higginsianum]